MVVFLTNSDAPQASSKWQQSKNPSKRDILIEDKTHQHTNTITITFLTLILPIVSLLSILFFITFSPFVQENAVLHHSQVRVFHFSLPTENTESNVLRRNTEVISYLAGHKHNLDHAFFSYEARVHLADVRQLFAVGAAIMLVGSIFLGMTLSHLFRRKQYRTLGIIFFGSGIVGLAGNILVGSASLLSWRQSFILFHQLFFFPFANEFWMLPDTDNLIQLYPDAFFFDMASIIIVTSTILSLLYATLGAIILRFCQIHAIME